MISFKNYTNSQGEVIYYTGNPDLEKLEVLFFSKVAPLIDNSTFLSEGEPFWDQRLALKKNTKHTISSLFFIL